MREACAGRGKTSKTPARIASEAPVSPSPSRTARTVVGRSWRSRSTTSNVAPRDPFIPMTPTATGLVLTRSSASVADATSTTSRPASRIDSAVVDRIPSSLSQTKASGRRIDFLLGRRRTPPRPGEYRHELWRLKSVTVLSAGKVSPQILDAPFNVAVLRLDRGDLREQVERAALVTRLEEDLGQVVAQAGQRRFFFAGRFERRAIPLDRRVGLTALPVAEPEHAARLTVELRSAARGAELLDRVVDEPHFLVGDPEVVVRAEVAAVDLGADVLLEGREDLVDRLLRFGFGGGGGHLARRSVGIESRGDRAELVLVEAVVAVGFQLGDRLGRG